MGTCKCCNSGQCSENCHCCSSCSCQKDTKNQSSNSCSCCNSGQCGPSCTCCSSCGCRSDAIRFAYFPELGQPHSGKVRDIYELKDGSLAIIASDRISVFDVILKELVPDKGRVLTELSRFWFENTKDIIENHVINFPDPNVMVVKKCKPLMLEVIVRAYMAGSMWRDYQSGKRDKCGVTLPEGLKLHERLPQIIVTPTTKSTEGHDEDITPQELINRGIITADLWSQIEDKVKKVFARGQEILDQKGLILVDAKYEFGLSPEGNLVLIDEIHTPDSSRFWFKSEVEKNDVKFPDKELLRIWMREQGFTGDGQPPAIPQDIIDKVRKGYRDIYETIVGKSLETDKGTASKRLLTNLKKAGLIKGKLVVFLMGSEKDQPHADKITSVLTKYGMPFLIIVASAHKQPAKVLDWIEKFNQSLQPLVFIGIAGRSNALGGVIAANLKWPVINCPPFKDYSDYLTNIHSSLQMPSNVPALTVIDAENAGLAALKILKLAS